MLQGAQHGVTVTLALSLRLVSASPLGSEVSSAPELKDEFILVGMDKYRPADIAEMEPRRSLISQPVPPENVGVLVPAQQRSLHAVIAQSLKDIEGLIARLETGVRVADSSRALVRDLYVQCRKQREVLAAVLRLELE